MSRHLPFPAISRLLGGMLAAATLLLASSLQAAPDSFAPLSVTLQPQVTPSPLPAWALGNILVEPAADAVAIPVPPLASQDLIGCFALTVTFQDNGDGGPVVEWLPKVGERILLSAGLGDNGVALGLNARTLLLSQSLSLDGGTLLVSFPGRFSRLLSVTLRPARELGVAALGAEFQPALIGEDSAVLTEQEVSGTEVPLPGGDRTEGRVIHAELSTLPKQLDQPGSGGEGVMEFVVPLSTVPQGSLLRAEIGGLDPESWIEVSVNGESFGALGIAPLPLNDPGVLFSTSGRLLFAGWRSASLFLPARLWKAGDNSLLLTLHRVAGDAGRPVYLRKAQAEFLFAPAGGIPLSPTNTAQVAVPIPTPAPTPAATPTPAPAETLSTGSLYGNPSPSLFHASLPNPLPLASSVTPNTTP